MKKTLTVLALTALMLPALALAQSSAPATSTSTSSSTSTKTTTTTMAKVVHINSANTRTLMTLPGVSSTIAAEIIKNRPYKNADELVKKVKGIGTKNIKKLTPLIAFN